MNACYFKQINKKMIYVIRYTLLAALQAYLEAGNNSKEFHSMHYNGIYLHKGK
jgi:hypothetical protein